MVKYLKRKYNKRCKSTKNTEYESGPVIILKKNNSKEITTKVKTPWYQKKESNGELKIRQYLQKNTINFNKEQKFSNLLNPKTNQQLRFDFYLPTLNTVIEFDGIQHSELTTKFHGLGKNGLIKFRNQIYKDCIKDLYCITNKIKLIRIKYTEYFEIERILNEKLK